MRFMWSLERSFATHDWELPLCSICMAQAVGLHQMVCEGIAAQRFEESLDAHRPF